MTRKVNTPANTTIKFEHSKMFIGMIIEKRNVVARCVAIHPYKRVDGVDSVILEWEISCKKTNRKIYKNTSASLRVGDIPGEIDQNEPS